MMNLEQKLEQEKVDRARRYPLLSIVNNRNEIKAISENACKMIVDNEPDLIITTWELIPTLSMKFILSTVKYLAQRKSTAIEAVEIEIGRMMNIGIEYARTEGEKDGTFNPYITTGKEFKFDFVQDTVDSISDELMVYKQENNAQFMNEELFKNKEEIMAISKEASKEIEKEFGATLGDWSMVPIATLYFMRSMRDFLIEECKKGQDVEITLGNVLTAGVEKTLDDNDEETFFLYIIPGQEIKLATKDDGATEEY